MLLLLHEFRFYQIRQTSREIHQALLVIALEHHADERLCTGRPDKDTGFLDGYRRRSFLLGQQIEVLGPSGARPARALAIDERAGLVVEYPSGARETLSSGEVSVRRRP